MYLWLRPCLKAYVAATWFDLIQRQQTLSAVHQQFVFVAGRSSVPVKDVVDILTQQGRVNGPASEDRSARTLPCCEVRPSLGASLGARKPRDDVDQSTALPGDDDPYHHPAAHP